MTRLSFIAVIGLALLSPARGQGTLIVCDDESDPQTMDPQKQFSEKNHTLLQQIYEGLVRFDNEGEIRPALALSWERMAPDRCRFHLRRNVEFHNGEPFDAHAVQFTVQRYLDPATGFPARSYLQHIDRVEVIDDHTVDFITQFPDGLLLNRLAAFVLIVPPKYVSEHGPQILEQRPMGTGPFRFVRWDRGQAIHMAANTRYWEPGLPRLQGLVFRFAPVAEQVQLLLDGKVDIVTELPGTLTQRVQEAENARVIKQRTYWTVGALINNSTGSPLADVRVRQALNYALDRDELVRYDVRGNGAVLATLTMPGEGGHDPELRPYPYDPKRAAELLAAAGVQPPLRLRVHVRAQSERAAKIIAAQLSRLGIELDLHIFHDSQVVQTLNDPTQHWDMGIAGVPDPMCHSFFIQSILLFSGSPYSLTKDEQFDGRLMRMASTADEQERDRLGRELDRYVHEQALSLFTYQKIKTYGVRQAVQFEPCVTGMPRFSEAAIK